jgi:hypothetical protein
VGPKLAGGAVFNTTCGPPGPITTSIFADAVGGCIQIKLSNTPTVKATTFFILIEFSYLLVILEFLNNLEIQLFDEPSLKH